MTDCIFCKIANQQIPSEIVYEDEWVLAFRDIEPAAPTHVLLIPKIHINNIVDQRLITDNLPVKLMEAIQKVTTELKLQDNGFRIIVNCGQDAGETVHHLHFHIVAGRPFGWPPG